MVVITYQMLKEKNRSKPYQNKSRVQFKAVFLFIAKFQSTFIHTYATGIGLKPGLSLPSPAGITFTFIIQVGVFFVCSCRQSLELPQHGMC